MAHHAPKRCPPRFASHLVLAIITSLAAGALGCGGSDPLVPAHSASFSPVRGVGDNGAAVSRLHWLRRVNGGQPIVAMSDPSISIQFSDSDMTAENDLVTTAVDGTVFVNGAAVGHESARSVDHLSPGSSPATVGEEDDTLTVSLTMSGVQMSENQMLKYLYTPPLSNFDRDDLDSMPVGTAGSFTSQAVVSGSVMATETGQSPETEMVSETIPISANWSIVDKLSTFQVLGQDYANVVVIQTTSSATDPTTGMTAEIDTKSWFAKGIGLIRTEQSGASLDVDGTLVLELVSTNLVP